MSLKAGMVAKVRARVPKPENKSPLTLGVAIVFEVGSAFAHHQLEAKSAKERTPLPPGNDAKDFHFLARDTSRDSDMLLHKKFFSVHLYRLTDHSKC